MAKENVIGKVYGRLTVIAELAEVARQRNVRCRCQCGREKTVRLCHIRSGATRSCGCLLSENTKALKTTHGHTSGAEHGLPRSPEYMAWRHMKSRCYDPKNKNFQDYGGRGITVCDDWKESFVSFFRDIGPRPSANHTLERLDTNGPYSQQNCRWATRREQTRNRRCTDRLTYKGETLPLIEWAERLHMDRGTLWSRVHQYHWSAERAIETPLRIR